MVTDRLLIGFYDLNEFFHVEPRTFLTLFILLSNLLSRIRNILLALSTFILPM